MIAGVYDTDGDLDLFVGGRILSGRYPLAPQSYILNNNKGKFPDVTSIICKELLFPGLVTSAVWADYNGDKAIDLIVCGQWMKITVFKNENGKLIQPILR